MFSWPFSSSRGTAHCPRAVALLVLCCAMLRSCRKMISRKVRCASVEFWKASKHLFRAKVLGQGTAIPVVTTCVVKRCTYKWPE
eukprot:Skav203887  [mRNA]  locus=scaffold1649:107516:107767:- [translate_table: standard]